MEVLSVYMDLQEWVKKWNVWKLESEAFKKPIELKIWYDNHDIKQFDSSIEELKNEINRHEKKFIKLEWDNVNHELFREGFQNKVNNKQYQIDGLREMVGSLSTEIKELYKVIADLKTTVETQSGTILHQQEQINQISKKLTKQPRVFKDKTFISWSEEVMLGLFEVPDGDYLCISNIEIGEHNEYCENTGWVIIDKIHVQDWFTPRYKLYWGTELDTPTAMVYYTLLLIPM